eukprot:404043-Rhodomonas_salina.1
MTSTSLTATRTRPTPTSRRPSKAKAGRAAGRREGGEAGARVHQPTMTTMIIRKRRARAGL